ncbi:MAG: hypothetical protein WDO15_26105 [Bacteroidota bacterium]
MAWFLKNKLWLIGAGFFILSTALRFFSGNQTSHPTGWDGYYYVMQVHSWMTYGHMQSPDYSLIYPYFTFITFFTSDPITGFRIGTAIIGGLLVISVYRYLLGKDVALIITCAACSYIVFSPLITYFVLQFPKNALGLVFFIFFMSSLKRPGVLTAVLFLCTILTHRMTGAFALLTIVVYALRFISWKWIIAGIAVMVAVGFLPGIIHVSDLARFDGQFTSAPHWAPLAFTNIFPTSLSWLFKADLVIISIAILLSIPLIIANSKSRIDICLWFTLLFISVFPFFSFSPGDIGHRFFMIAPVAVVVLICLVSKPTTIPSLIFTGSFVILSVISYRSYKPWAFDAPNNAYATVVDRLTNRFRPERYPLVIAHKGLAEMIIFKTNFDALNWLPPKNLSPDSVLRITYRVLDSDFRSYLGPDDLQQVKTIANRYFTVPENTWQKFVTAAKNDNKPAVIKRIFNNSNPMNERPYFIRKGKKQ